MQLISWFYLFPWALPILLKFQYLVKRTCFVHNRNYSPYVPFIKQLFKYTYNIKWTWQSGSSIIQIEFASQQIKSSDFMRVSQTFRDPFHEISEQQISFTICLHDQPGWSWTYIIPMLKVCSLDKLNHNSFLINEQKWMYIK